MKIFFRSLSLVIALLLALSLLGTFASCDAAESEEDAADKGTEAPTEAPTKAPPADPPVEISAEMQSEIKNKYFEKTYEEKNKEYYNSPDEVVIMDCYGIFDDAYCIMITCSRFMYLDVMTEIQVGEYTFVFSSSNTMKVYCNGEFYGLKQAYEKGILDDAELESLHYYYTKSEMEHYLKTTYFRRTYDEKYKEHYNSPDQVTIEACYGIFDDAYCAIITYPLVEYTCEETKVEVGGYTFVFGSSNTMIVYCDGKIYSLEKAYEKGILDDAELESLHYYYTKSKMEHHLKTTYFLSTYDEKYKEHYNSPDQVTIEACYGIFDDAYCAIISYPLVAYACVETEVEVGGYTFVFGSRNTMKVYCDGKIYSLEKAYEKGILDDAELESLYNNYTKARG